MTILGTLLITTALAGVAGTALGGILGALLHRDSDKTMSLLLSFAGGVMLSIVCFDLIQDALETGVGALTVAGALLTGVAVIYLLNYVIDRKTDSELRDRNGKLSLVIAGVVMAGSVAIHNVPVGMTIGASYAGHGGALGNGALVLSILIGLHNIPEGMAIAAPLIGGGFSRSKAVLLTALSGVPTMIGALCGYWLGDIGDMGLALSLGFASGTMLCVVCGEILPQAILMYRSKLPAFFTIVGVVAGLLVIYL